jgi:hypothetical protein
MPMAPTQEPVITARADLIAILEELHDVLVQLGNQTVDRRYVDFAAMTERLEECIERIGNLYDGERPAGDI